MKFNVGRWAAVVLLSIFMLGCTSIRARTQILDNNQWTVYPGVQQDAKETWQIVTGEHPEASNENTSKPGWIQGMIATILAFDLPFSAVFDTVAMPYDVYRIFNPQSFKENHANSGANSSQAPEK